jgi:hypothetical protein
MPHWAFPERARQIRVRFAGCSLLGPALRAGACPRTAPSARRGATWPALPGPDRSGAFGPTSRDRGSPLPRTPSPNNVPIKTTYPLGIQERQQELVDGRSTAERDLSSKRWRVEQVAECAADDQVLFDLRRVRPRGVLAPGLDVSLRDQASTSMTSLSSSFQDESRSGTSASAATIGLTLGSRGAKCLALSAYTCKARDCLAWPAC